MTAVLEWTETDAPGIGEAGVNRIWTEVDDSGIILREIGLDSTGGVVYIAPAPRRARPVRSSTPSSCWAIRRTPMRTSR